MEQKKDMIGKIPLWAQLRIAHDFANDDEKKQLESFVKQAINDNLDFYLLQDTSG